MEPSTLLDYIFVTFWTDFKEYVLTGDAHRRVALEDRFLYFYNIMNKKNCLPVVRLPLSKDFQKTEEYRKLGDEAFFERRNVSAVKWYTRSISVARPESPELATCFANRSAALYRLEAYTAALIDMNRALQGQYPENLKPKLQDRKIKCISQLQTNRSTTATYMVLHKPGVCNTVVGMGPAYGQPTSPPCNISYDTEITDMNYEYRFPIPSAENYTADIELPFIHKRAIVKFNTHYGRHIVATEDMKPGETLGVEKPITSILSLKYRYSHCSQCFVRCEALIGCPSCSLMMFCSKKCRQSAYEQYHRVECKIYFHSHHYAIRDDIWLALRMLLVVTKQGANLKTLMNHPTYKNSMNIDPAYIPLNFETDNYLNIHNLQDNIDKASFEENYTFGFTAALMLHILKHSEFFIRKTESGPKVDGSGDTHLSAEELFAGKLLLKFLFIIKHNAFKITETLQDEENPIIKFTTLEIGTSIYLFHSFYNHSCDENSTATFNQDFIVTRAIQSVKAGEKLFLSYGMNYGKIPVRGRQQYLRDVYKLDCKCPPCSMDWPLLETDTTAIQPKLKRNSIKLDLLKTHIRKTQEIRKASLTYFDKPKFDLLCHYLDIYHKNVKKPWKEYYDCQEKLKEIFALGSNYYSKLIDQFLLDL